MFFLPNLFTFVQTLYESIIQTINLLILINAHLISPCISFVVFCWANETCLNLIVKNLELYTQLSQMSDVGYKTVTCHDLSSVKQIE